MQDEQVQILFQGIDYLGHVITQEGITPCQKKIEAILKIAVPRTVKQLGRFIGMVNYYHDMYPKRSELIRGLTKIAGSKKKFWKKGPTMIDPLLQLPSSSAVRCHWRSSCSLMFILAH
jgi:hypothetical protein